MAEINRKIEGIPGVKNTVLKMSMQHRAIFIKAPEILFSKVEKKC